MAIPTNIFVSVWNWGANIKRWTCVNRMHLQRTLVTSIPNEVNAMRRSVQDLRVRITILQGIVRAVQYHSPNIIEVRVIRSKCSTQKGVLQSVHALRPK